MASKLFNRIWKWITGAGILLIIYGYACRLLSIYFFWESRFTGWIALCLGLAIYFAKLITRKKMKNSVLETIACCILLFLAIYQLAMIVIFSNAHAFRQARQLIAEQQDIIAETGKLKSISLTPIGKIEMSHNGLADFGSASFKLILKGENKYIDLEVELSKVPASEWTLIKYRY